MLQRLDTAFHTLNEVSLQQADPFEIHVIPPIVYHLLATSAGLS